MSEFQAFFQMKITECFVIQYPSKRWGFVGRVPVELAFVDGTTNEEIEKGRSFGEAFGPKKRSFSTKEEAIAFAESKGHKVKESTPCAEKD